MTRGGDTGVHVTTCSATTCALEPRAGAPAKQLHTMGASQIVELWPQFPTSTILLVILPLVSFLVHRSVKYRPGAKLFPPGPWCLPMVGNLHQIGPLPHRSLSALARRHGPVMTVWLGTVPAVVLSSPEAAREALRTHDADCSSRPPSAGPRLLSYGYKDVAFSPYSDHVREMRKIFILELLSRRRVQAACYARDVQVEKLVRNLTSMGANPVPIADHIFATVDGIIGSFAFGENYATEQFKGEFVPVLNESTVMLGSFAAEDFFPGACRPAADWWTELRGSRPVGRGSSGSSMASSNRSSTSTRILAAESLHTTTTAAPPCSCKSLSTCGRTGATLPGIMSKPCSWHVLL
uniref:Uncharacterized protein n=1 Tax=Avena sativa TaxID=4498 RepID=A0ACD5VWQ6_AVESA